MPIKIVINVSRGEGFRISKKAIKRYAEKCGLDPNDVSDYDFIRDDPDLVEIVEELGHRSWGHDACLKVVEIPDSVNWKIVEYEGDEHIAEIHRTWR